MDENNQNILYAGKEELNALLSGVNELDDFKSRIDVLEAFCEKQEKAVKAKEKQIADEIAETVKKRKSELSGTFKGTEKDIRVQEKKVRAKKEKERQEKVAERIVSENEGNVHRIEVLKEEAKNEFKAARVPGFYNTSFYYCIFFPKTIAEHLLRVLAFCIVFAGIPFAAYMLVPENLKTPWFMAVLYVLLILVFGFLFVYVLGKSKGKYNETVIKGRHFRNDIQAVKREIRRKGRQIRKDKDDSRYGLENFDSEIAGLRAELDETVNRRKNAIDEFESSTKDAIRSEIESRNREELQKMSAELEKSKAELSELRGAAKAKSLYITEKYSAFMGKEFVNATCISKLIEIIDEGKATTVGEALAVYKTEDKN